SKKHPLGEKRNHPGSKLRQGFWMVFRLGVNNWGIKVFKPIVKRKEKNMAQKVLLSCSCFN
ncbi:hypothetical protein, partial [Streptococcus pneumoniae]|uniref:hypothetical protein n=1 Tax=Streptococcus pneumoniae TaxID=1313 RepID=UPI001E2E7DD5